MTINCNNANYKKGSKGEEIKKIQTILKNKGFYGGLIDGDYGDVTVDAVKKYQRSVDITVDGWTGPITCKKLNSTSITTTTQNTTTFDKIQGKKFLKAEIERVATIYRNHIKHNKNYPDYLEIIDANTNKYNVPRSAYMGLFEDVSIFAVKNGRMPNYVIANSTANNPLAIDYQNNGYNCGPTSLSMCMQMLALWISEPTLAKACRTTSNGTSPAQLITAAKQYNMELKEIPRNINSVKQSLNEGCPVLMHIHTSYSGGKSCLGYYGSYGHYIMCYGISGNSYKLADPTKGFKTCNSTSIDNAKSSTNMKYYQLKPV